MKLTIARLLAIPLMLVVALPVWAQPDEASLLKKEHVEGFLDALSELQAWDDKNDQQLEEMEASGDTGKFSDAYSTLIAGFQGHSLADELTAIVNRHGFENLEGWAAAGTRMIQVYSVVKYEETAAEREAALAEALKQIEQSPLDDAQKEAMRKALGAGADVMSMFGDVTETEKRVVKPFMERIERMGDKEDPE